MFTKRALLASTALAFVAGASAEAGETYVTVLGGANWQQKTSGFHIVGTGITRATTAFAADPDTGFMIGGAVGLHLDQWAKHLRGEIEASYRRNDISGTFFQHGFIAQAGNIDANISTFAVMANLWYDVDVGQKWTPYLGGGAGWARTKAEGAFLKTFPSAHSNHFSAEESGFAWQLGLGVNYPIADGVTLGVGYRYFRGPSVDNDVFVGKHNLPVPSTGTTTPSLSI